MSEPRERLLVVELSGLGLSEGGDVADLVIEREQDGKAPEEIRADLDELAKRASAWKRATPRVVAAEQGEQGWAGPPNRPKPLGPAPAGGAERDPLSNYYFAERWQPDTKKGSRARQAGSDANIAAELAEFRKLAMEVTDTDFVVAQFWQENAGPMTEEITKLVRKVERFQYLIEEFKAEKQAVPMAKDIALVREEATKVLKDWPHRLRAPGAVKLFFDSGDDEVREITDPTDFCAMLKSYAQLKFNGGQDLAGTNYTTIEELYKHMGRSERVTEWLSADRIPHEPPYEGHYCNWRWPEYVADGRTLARFVRFFDQVTDPTSKAILAASAITPFWGGPYKERPAFVYDADQPGSGKTTAAEVVATIACPFGAMMLNLDRRSEERIKERLLSPEGRTKPIAIVDNVKGAKVDSSLLEELVTCTWISGKELRVGESSRPNTMTYFITANNAHLSDDMTRRCFRVHFDPLAMAKGGGERAAWIRDVLGFIRENAACLIADAIWMLRRCPPFDWTGLKGERNSLWVEKVLGAVLACPAVMEAVGSASATNILRSNQAWRDDSNEDLDEALRFREGLYERLWDWKAYRFPTGLDGSHLPTRPIFMRTEKPPKKAHDEYTDARESKEYRELQDNNMVEYWSQIFTRPDISAKWLVKTVKAHIVSGRLKGIEQYRDTKTGIRGWHIDHVELVKYHLGLISDANTRAQCEAHFLEKLKAPAPQQASEVSEASIAPDT